ncbi:hypothetical protein [Gibbsiella quercinecans]|uniref:hypothetical protein n=1 Tax=Gibbsiella quercinecans TaxID=929813 RepID=UPI000EF1301E|nr:hypothetical protein [Gibbsiella quercinecans]RLM04080.1 hypothetical protein BIY31_19895 [Gibbsiella quercinecans]
MKHKDRFKLLDEVGWHEFAVEYLCEMGYVTYATDEKHAITVFNNKRYLVSIKHNINTGSVGVGDEIDVLLRMKEYNVDGFIGFYSGYYSTSLLNRLNSIVDELILFNCDKISTLLVFAHSQFIDKYLPSEKSISVPHNIWRYYQNVSNENYEPLLCMCGCGVDILEPRNIGWAMATIYRKNRKVYFIYGLKDCFFPKGNVDNTECGWLELNQALHTDQINDWNSMIDEYLESLEGFNLTDYYYHKYNFMSKIVQRLRPVNSGIFLRLE